MDKYKNIKSLVFSAQENVKDLNSLESFRQEFLGKKGSISVAMKELGTLDPEERKKNAEELNIIKNSVLSFVKIKTDEINSQILDKQIKTEFLDVTLPVGSSLGTIHPITQVIDEVITIFADLDFCVAEGPEIETDYNNFTALNTSEHHPARQMHDTFYVDYLT